MEKKKRRNGVGYVLPLKLDIVKECKETSVKIVAEKYDIRYRRLKEWVKMYGQD